MAGIRTTAGRLRKDRTYPTRIRLIAKPFAGPPTIVHEARCPNCARHVPITLMAMGSVAVLGPHGPSLGGNASCEGSNRTILEA